MSPRTAAEIDRGIRKLQDRLGDLEELNVRSAVVAQTGAVDVVCSKIIETIREIFGSDSEEFGEHGHIRIWAGPTGNDMSRGDIIAGTEQGKVRIAGILNGLISSLSERRQDLVRRRPGRGRRGILALVLVLAVANVYLVMTRETGPPSELEALHSSDDAIGQCRVDIESRLSQLGGEVEGSLEAEYLQGGEYVVRGAVSVVDGSNRIVRPILCEAQFRPESGWSIEHVEVGS